MAIAITLNDPGQNVLSPGYDSYDTHVLCWSTTRQTPFTFRMSMYPPPPHNPQK
jgi:hypothetical protein